MIRWSYSQWNTALVALLAFVGSATLAINVAHGVYPPWLAWPGFLLGALAMIDVSVLVHETKVERHESRVQKFGGGA